MTDPEPVRLESGVPILDTSYNQDVFSLAGWSHAELEGLADLSEEARQEEGGTLDVFASRIVTLFVQCRVSYWAADAALNCAMEAAKWKAPVWFWQVFIAFEDAETAADPQASALMALAQFPKLKPSVFGE